MTALASVIKLCRTKLAVSIGIVAQGFLQLLVPDLQAPIALLNVAVCMLWIWG